MNNSKLSKQIFEFIIAQPNVYDNRNPDVLIFHQYFRFPVSEKIDLINYWRKFVQKIDKFYFYKNEREHEPVKLEFDVLRTLASLSPFKKRNVKILVTREQ